MKKTWTCGILAAMLALTLVGCGKRAETPVVIAEPVQTETTEQKKTETAKPTQGKAEATKPTQGKAETAKPTQEKTENTKPAQGKTGTAGTGKDTSGKSTEPRATEPKATEPKATEPKATEPKATEPKATEPKATEPKATEPKATEPKATEPKATEPKATEPKATEPKPTKPSHTHSYRGSVTAPTCTEKGYTVYTCQSCGSSYRGEETAPLGHRYKETVKAATCLSGGETVHTCTVCGDSYQDRETGALGHSYAERKTEATCTETGSLDKVCTRCGDRQTVQVFPALGHSCTTWSVSKQPTEEAAGEETGTCDACGETVTRPVEKLEHVHQWQTVQTVEPTCYQPGYHLLRCACGEERQENTQDALGHDFHDDREVPKTCTENGALYQVCSRCGIELKLVIPADHTWKMIPPEYSTRYYAVCPHCNVYLCELDGNSDPNAALWAHIEATDGLFYNHSWCNEYEKTMVKPESFYCAVCGVTYQE